MFTCIPLQLQVTTGSNLETRYRYHPQSQPYQFNATALRSRWFRGHASKWCLVQICHIFFTQGLQFSHTFCLDLILLCNLLQCSGTRSVLTNVRGVPPYTGVEVPNFWICHAVMIQLKSKASCLPNLESALIL